MSPSNLAGSTADTNTFLESILERGMPLTFDAEDKAFAKIDPHALELEPVPMLMIGSKPASKNDADSSVRTSSPAPSNTPSTPIKSAKQPRNPQVRERLLPAVTFCC